MESPFDPVLLPRKGGGSVFPPEDPTIQSIDWMDTRIRIPRRIRAESTPRMNRTARTLHTIVFVPISTDKPGTWDPETD